MSGIILLIVAALWLTVLFWVVQKIGNLVPPNRSQKLLKIVLFAVLLPLPLMDELMAKSEVDEFCRKNATVVFDVDKLQGRSIRFLQYKSTPVFFGTLKGTDQQAFYKDVNSEEVVYHYSMLSMEGGWLIRKLGISETNSPFLFDKNCGPKDIDLIERKYNITRLL